jgi:hypothetical protein
MPLDSEMHFQVLCFGTVLSIEQLGCLLLLDMLSLKFLLLYHKLLAHNVYILE